MRVLPVFVLVLLLSMLGCASVAPREYLDTETAATITVVAKPWIFMADDKVNSYDKQAFLNLYALDVNRTGRHQLYFAVMQTSFDDSLPSSKSVAPTLEIQAAGHTTPFQAVTQTPRELGVAQPLEQPFALAARWWYFPVTKEDLATIAQTRNLLAALVTQKGRAAYIEFRNGSAELTELSATMR